MRMRICLLSVLASLVCLTGTVDAGFTEDWNDSFDKNNDWQYWIDSTNTSIRPGEPGENKDMKWEATGGVGDTGFVWSPGNELKYTWDRYWPAYMAPPDRVANIDLQNQSLSISVNDLNTLGTSAAPSLHFFIGEWNVNGTSPDDDTYIFFQHRSTIAVGANRWTETTFDIGDNSQWSVILKSTGNTTTPSDLYLNPQQWGFVIDESTLPSGMQLGFDHLVVVPEPSMLALWVLAGFFGLGMWPVFLRRARSVRAC